MPNPRKQGAPPERRPLTSLLVLRTIQHHHMTYREYPISSQVYQAIPEYGEAEIRLRINNLIRLGEIEVRDNRLVPTDLATVATPVTVETWDRERLEAHLRSIGVDPTPAPKR